MGVTTTRGLNATKLNTTHLYTHPYRTAIPVLQSLLLLFAALTFALTWLFVERASYRHWNFIWLYVFALLILYHPIELLRRYQRLSTAFEVTISASVVLCWWILTVCFEAFGSLLWGLGVAPVGLVLAVVYLGFAVSALRKERMVTRAEGKGMELGTQFSRSHLETGRARLEGTAKTASQETILAEARAANEQKWSPLGD